jgi:hypothetical protein
VDGLDMAAPYRRTPTSGTAPHARIRSTRPRGRRSAGHQAGGDGGTQLPARLAGVSVERSHYRQRLPQIASTADRSVSSLPTSRRPWCRCRRGRRARTVGRRWPPAWGSRSGRRSNINKGTQPVTRRRPPWRPATGRSAVAHLVRPTTRGSRDVVTVDSVKLRSLSRGREGGGW